MTSLAHTACEPCSGNATPLSYSASEAYLETLPEWQIVERDGIMTLRRDFTFRDFASALDVTQRIGEIAEQAGHHPLITTQWGKVTVMWWSHNIKGLHINDFILAARTDEVAE